MTTPAQAIGRTTVDPRGVLRRIFSDAIKAKYDPLEPSRRTDVERHDVAACIITNIEKAGWVLADPETVYDPFE
jgi:hypothetical protein